MRTTGFILFLAIQICEVCGAYGQARSNAGKGGGVYYPGREWEERLPSAMGLDTVEIGAAVTFAIASESENPRNMELSHYQSFGKEPFGDGIGLFKERGAPSGIIVYKGYIVASWGEPGRVDMTHSVTKSFLSTVVGLAFDRGLIPDIHEKVYLSQAPVHLLEPNPFLDRAERIGQPMLLDLFSTPHNREITWDHLLRQTSDWEGVLWGKPDWADRPAANASEWYVRRYHTPGTVYEYNDVRVNVLSLAALNIWRRPLPEVLRMYIMDPIGASPTWRWFGYKNSWVVIDGSMVQSVSGGGHWGGGMFINAYDMARFGYLTLRRGYWKDRQLISERWLDMALTPTPSQPTYGFMNYFLNTEQKLLPSAPAESFYHLGNGTNMVYVDPVHDLVIVARWIKNNAMDGLVSRVISALPK
ncbi:MAG: serine hydrolase domain-containing protein [Saprospiraceae bacterium]